MMDLTMILFAIVVVAFVMHVVDDYKKGDY